MTKCIVNFSNGIYVKSQDRLRETLKKHKWDGGTEFWTGRVPGGAKEHYQVPYQFKPYAIWNAYLMGYRQILWLDAPIHPNKELDSIFYKIYKNGYFILGDPGWNFGEWCSDAALKFLKIDREFSFTVPTCLSGVLAFDLSRPEVMEVFLKWKDTSDALFPGSWKNECGEVSSDKRVRGHRHDQTSISIYAYQAGWEFTDPNESNIFYYGNNEDYILNIYHA